eukprot:486852_1
MSAISSNQNKCIKYTGKDEQKEYNECNWYYMQIKRYMGENPYSSRLDQWNWFKHIAYFKQNTFWNYCRQHHALNVKKKKIKPKSKSNSDIIKQKAFALFDKESDDTVDIKYIIQTLNKLSSLKTAPAILHKYPLGWCLAAMIEYKQTINRLGNSKSYTIQMHKQIMLSAIVNVDNTQKKKKRKKAKKKNNSNNQDQKDENIQEYIEYDINCTNSAFVRNLGSDTLLKQCVKVKHEFNETNKK